jgi:hypothetical protein
LQASARLNLEPSLPVIFFDLVVVTIPRIPRFLRGSSMPTATFSLSFYGALFPLYPFFEVEVVIQWVSTPYMLHVRELPWPEDW